MNLAICDSRKLEFKVDQKLQALLLLIAAISGVTSQSERSPTCIHSLHSIPLTLAGYQIVCMHMIGELHLKLYELGLRTNYTGSEPGTRIHQ